MASISGDGFTADFDPTISLQNFTSQLSLMMNMLFSDSSIGVLISFTTYCVRGDIWTSNFVFYESFGLNQYDNEVYVSLIRSYPFKPNFYETPMEK